MEINGPRRDKKFKSHHHIDTDRHNAWRKVKYFLVYSESWQLLLADKVTLTAGGPIPVTRVSNRYAEVQV